MNYQKIEHQALVISKEQLNDENVMLEFSCPAIAHNATIGQFVALESSTFLRRPLGIASVDRLNGSFKVGFQIKGEGTQALAALETGQSLSVLGPLGHGFDIARKTRILIVGGGTGVYPLLFTLEQLRDEGIQTAAAFGFRSAKQLILEAEFRQATEALAIALESAPTDGQPYVTGNVIHAATTVLESSGLFDDVDPDSCLILTVGPTPMLLAVAGFAAARGIDCQVSLEERMACGVGYCRTCNCKTKTGPGHDDWDYERVCIEGPVFPAERIFS